jgi:hypothetical protein
MINVKGLRIAYATSAMTSVCTKECHSKAILSFIKTLLEGRITFDEGLVSIS